MSFITDPSKVIFKGHFEGMVSIIDQALCIYCRTRLHGYCWEPYYSNSI